MAHMGKVVSNELVRVSEDTGLSQELRDYASDVLSNHDASGTNTYAEIETFLDGFSITNEPTISSNVILIMQTSIELGISAKQKLQAYVVDTNMTENLRDMSQRMLDSLDPPSE
ncbi:MAG: hypothetical protein PHI39_04440 [Kiritimatiellae bacterium]|nr:hypothetical protein [Kiritimatiellia bacterium]